jgi:hypothetical protein
MPMRERRAAHVRPRPPSSDRLRDDTIRADAPSHGALRRYGPVRSGPQIGAATALALVGGCIVLGLVALNLGAGLVGDLSSAFGNAMSRLSSQAPATPPPSGVALDTPVLDAPDNNGYMNQTPAPVQGSAPGAALGKTGYAVVVYRIGKDDARQQVAQVALGATTRFITPPIPMNEGNNVFVATLKTPTGEGQPSPPVTYILDTAPPPITVTSPGQNAQLSAGSLDVSGKTDPGVTVTIRNRQAPGGAQSNQTVGADGRFKLTVPVVAGPNTIDLTAIDQAGNSSSSSLTVNRYYGQLAAHLTATPAKFSSTSQTTVTLTIHATSANGGPLANARATFTVQIQGLGPIDSPELTTDATGVATWQVPISGGAPGNGRASVLVTSPGGDEVRETTAITTT